MMTRNSSSLREPPGDIDTAVIDGLQEPALLIDADGAQCLAANAAASLALGMAGASQFPLALDSAMPAIATLRAFAHSPSVQTRQSVRVTMWLGGRPVSATCELSHVSATGPRSTVVVKLLEISGNPSEPVDAQHDPPVLPPLRAQPQAPFEPVSAPATAPAPGDEDDEPVAPPLVARDDAQTLKEIARRIREGLPPQSRESAAEPSVPPAVNSAAQRRQDEPVPTAEQPAPAASDPVLHDTRAKLAHELKTPLSAIIAASEIMRDERLGPMGNQNYLGYASDIHESASHALSVITKMLSKATSEPASRNARVDLNDLAVRTVSSMQALAAERELSLDVDLEDGLPYVLGDDTSIRQILLNLLANALKFTPPGGAIRVVTGYLMNGSAFLVVRDTGDGMDQATLDHVFGTDGKIGVRQGGGYGIGLPLVRRLAKDMGADLEIDSAPFKGTVVLLSFPRHLLLDD